MSCISTFKSKGLKLTPQRKLILEFIHYVDDDLTAERIISYVQEKMPGVNKSTIYRTLEILEEAGCVYKNEQGNHVVYHHPEEGHRHHLVCSKCGKTIDCDENIFTSVEKSIREEHGFHISLKHMVVKGLCHECRSKAD